MPEAQCPFLKQECIRERCQLWSGLDANQPGPLAGTGRVVHIEGCIFHVIVFALTMPRPVPLPPKPLTKNPHS